MEHYEIFSGCKVDEFTKKWFSVKGGEAGIFQLILFALIEAMGYHIRSMRDTD